MIAKKIQKLAFKRPNEEVCGFIYLEDGGFNVLEVENMAEDKSCEFYISAKSFLYAKENNNLVAVFHSHPTGNEELSEYDKNCSEATCMPFVVFSNKTGRFFVYEPEFLDADKDLIERLKKEL